MQRRIVDYYNNSNISNEVLDRMKNIALLRCDKNDDSDIICNIVQSLDSVCYGIYDTELVNIVLGEDWFLVYVSDCDEVIFEAWVARNDIDNKFLQSVEMFREFKKILLDNSDKIFFASMKKTTSYSFYEKLLKMDYVEEFDEMVTFAFYTPPEIIEDISMKCGSIDCYLNSGCTDVDCDFNENAMGYLFCDIEFGVTEKFVKKYKK